jgi:methylamine dehydrogenase heavy chain
MFGHTAFFVSYHGAVLPLDIASEPAQSGAAWSLLNDEERGEGWKPGGWQPLARHEGKGLLFVLMHRGGEWTQKEPGTEIWVYDIGTKKRVNRIVLPKQADSILASQDSDPLLFAESESPATLQSFSALRGNYLGILKDLFGITFELYGSGG